MGCVADDDSWLMKQLRLSRDQLSKKSGLCDQLAAELRRLEGDLEARNEAARDARAELRSCDQRLRAQAFASQQARAAQEEEAAALRAEVEALRAAASAGEQSPTAVPTPRLCALSDADAEAEAAPPGKPVERSAEQQLERALQEAVAAAQREAKELRAKLTREHEAREDAEEALRAQRDLGNCQVSELQQELSEIAGGLEDKEEEIYNIQFDMASLQNELTDKAQLVTSNAEAFQQVSEELADKDERLEKAIARQEELMAQMNRVSEQLQEKVTRLSQELEGSRTAYQTLDEQTRVVVKRLENDRERLSNEVDRVKSEAAADAEAKVADKLASLEEELRQADLLSRTAALAAAASHAEAVEEALQRGRADSSVGELFRPSPLDSDGPAVMHLAAKPLFGRTLSTMSAASSCQLASTEGWLAATEERLSIAESQVSDLQAALARSRLVEQQATERAQEYRTSLELYKEFGAEGFLFAPTEREPIAPISPLGTGTMEKLRPTSSAHLEETCSTEGSAGNLAAPPVSEVALPSVLIAMELDLGVATATLRVAPWQTRSDFDEVVREFLVENRVKLVFAEALVKYLEEVEVQASSFPAFVKADLADVYSLYA